MTCKILGFFMTKDLGILWVTPSSYYIFNLLVWQLFPQPVVLITTPQNIMKMSNTTTVCSCHVTYAFQRESTLYSCLNVKELLARRRREIWRWSDYNWTRTQNHLVLKQTLNHLAKLVLGLSPVAVTSPSDFAPALSKEFLDIQATIECGFTLKRVRDMTRTYSQMYRTDQYSKRSSIIKWPVWPNGWVFV